MAWTEPVEAEDQRGTPRVDAHSLAVETERLLDTRKITTVALYSTEPEPEGRERPDARLPHETSVAWLAPEDGLYRKLLLASAGQLPRVVSMKNVTALTPVPAPELISIDRATVMLFALPSGGHVIALWLLYELRGAAATRPLPELFKVIDADRWTLCCDDRSVLDVALEGTGLGSPEKRRLRLGPDFHAITFLPDEAWQTEPILTRDAVQRLVSRQDRPSRAEFLTARLPPEANRYEDMMAAVTPGASALAGHEPQACVAFLLSAIQAMASLSSLRQLQRRAFAELSAVELDGSQSRAGALEEIEGRAEDLRSLQLDLSFAVETFLDIRLIIPSLPVQQFHNDLVGALAISEGAKVTGTMLARLEGAQNARVQALTARRARERDVWQGTAALLASLAIPLTLCVGFLGINTSEVTSDSSLADQTYWPWYGAFAGVTILIVLIGLLRRQRVRRT